MARSTITSRLPKYEADVKETLKRILNDQQSVALTADIWSDRLMRSFLGVTVHINLTKPVSGVVEDLGLHSYLLTCRRFQGSHTGAAIGSAFDEIMEEFEIKNKVKLA